MIWYSQEIMRNQNKVRMFVHSHHASSISGSREKRRFTLDRGSSQSQENAHSDNFHQDIF